MRFLHPPFRRSILILWIASVLMVVYLSLSPRIELPYDFDNADKVYHMLAYLWLAALPFFAFLSSKEALVATLSMIPLGVGLEIGQYFVPGRLFSLADMAANCLGVIVGIWLARFAKRFRFRSSSG